MKLEIDGKPISSSEYLEQALQPIQLPSSNSSNTAVDSSSNKIKAKNAIRESIKQFFPDRFCKTLRRPVTDEDLLLQLSDLPQSSLRKEFVQEVEDLIHFVYENVEVKRMFGQVLTGQMWLSLAQAYVDSVNSGSVPVISTAWNSVMEREIDEAVKLGVKSYEMGWKEKWSSTDDPFEISQIITNHSSLFSISIDVFFSKIGASSSFSNGNIKKYFNSLLSSINEIYKYNLELNEEKSKNQCQALIELTVKKLEESILKDSDLTLEQIEALYSVTLTQKYNNSAKGPFHDSILSTMLKKKPFEHAAIVFHRSIANISSKFKSELDIKGNEAREEFEKLESLYLDVKASWLKAKEDCRLLSSENNKLIGVVANLSNAINSDDIILSSPPSSAGAIEKGGNTK